MTDLNEVSGRRRVNVASLDPAERNLRRAVHKTIRKVTEDVEERFHFNTAIASVMELLNTLQSAESCTPQSAAVMREALQSVVLLDGPLCAAHHRRVVAAYG